MMAAGLTVRVLGDKKVLAGIQAVLRAGQNPKPMLEKITIIIQRAVDLNFQRQGRPARWKPSIRATEQGGQTLRDTDELHKSVAVHPVVKIGKNTLTFGTKKKQAPSMHFGYPPRNIPARPFLVITDEDKKKIETLLKDEIRKDYAFGKVAG